MPAIIFLLAILVVPTLPGAAVTPRWALIAIAVPFAWYFIPRPQITAGHLLGLVFLAWSALSLIWTFNFLEGAYQLGQFMVLGLIFCIGAGYGDLRKVYIAAGLGAAANSAVVIAQFWGWDVLPQTVPPAGMFFNKNFTAEFCAMALIGCLGLGPYTRWRWLALGCLPALYFCHSRASEIALAFAAILFIYQYYKPAAVLFLALLGGVGAYLWSVNYTATQRFQIWADSWDGMTFLGRGIGSFYGAFPEYATRIDPLALRPSQAHSDVIQLFYETGPGALAIIALVVFALRAKPLRTEHYVLVVFLVIGLVGFPLYLPATAAFAALVLGSLCGGRDELRLALPLGRSGVRRGNSGGVEPRRHFGAPRQGASVGSLEPRHTRWWSVLFYGVPAVRLPVSGGRDHRKRVKGQPLRC